jgi:hypothetical protein
MTFELLHMLAYLARVGYAVRGWDLAGALFEGGVLGQKGTEYRALLDTVENGVLSGEGLG